MSVSLLRRRRRRDPAQDRLATAVFVAALVHGLVILGVRFGAPIVADQPLPTLEILLVPTGPDEAEPNDSAAYLAQRTQRGSGTSDDVRRSSLPEVPHGPRTGPCTCSRSDARRRRRTSTPSCEPQPGAAPRVWI